MSQPTRPDVRVAVERQGPDVTLTVIGEIDLATVEEVSSRLTRLANGAGGDAERIVVDLSGVGFMGASGLSALVTAEQALRRRGSTLRVRAPQRVVAHLFELTGLDHFLERAPLGADHDRTDVGTAGDGAGMGADGATADGGARPPGAMRVLRTARRRGRS